MLDVKQLIAEVAARNGIRIDADDPAFCLVTMNQLVLEETARRIVGEIRAATQDFELAAEKVHRRSGVVFAQTHRELLAALRRDLDESVWARPPANAQCAMRWTPMSALWSLVLFASGVLVGIMFR